MKNLIKTCTVGYPVSTPGFAPAPAHVTVQQRKRLVGSVAGNAQAMIVDFPPDLSAPFDGRSP